MECMQIICYWPQIWTHSKRKLSDSARKRNKKAANAKLNRSWIYIGDEYDRWMEIKTAFHLETNSEVANIIFVSIYIPLFSIQSTIKNNFPLAKR
jgi:hypothetical protein